jgi:hypothetical protein
MRILVGISQYADHLNLAAADLMGNIAVEILRRHKLDRAVGTQCSIGSCTTSAFMTVNETAKKRTAFLRCEMTRLALSGQFNRARVCPLLDQSGQR